MSQASSLQINLDPLNREAAHFLLDMYQKHWDQHQIREVQYHTYHTLLTVDSHKLVRLM